MCIISGGALITARLPLRIVQVALDSGTPMHFASSLHTHIYTLSVQRILTCFTPAHVYSIHIPPPPVSLCGFMTMCKLRIIEIQIIDAALLPTISTISSSWGSNIHTSRDLQFDYDFIIPLWMEEKNYFRNFIYYSFGLYNIMLLNVNK